MAKIIKPLTVTEVNNNKHDRGNVSTYHQGYFLALVASVSWFRT
ncbi:hypothetical protein [Muribacter muris]|nr:hypothetical protein [Muribacter muris]